LGSNLSMCNTFLIKLIPPPDIVNYSKPKRDLRLEFECSYFEDMDISHPNSDILWGTRILYVFSFHHLPCEETAVSGVK
jgi:hypothetical protein